MSNERQETIADIVAQLRAAAHIQNADSPRDVLNFADRIEAAAKRERESGADAAHQLEVAELRKCLMEAVTEVCNRLEKCGFKEPCVFKTCYVQKWRKALEGASDAR